MNELKNIKNLEDKCDCADNICGCTISTSTVREYLKKIKSEYKKEIEKKDCNCINKNRKHCSGCSIYYKNLGE